MQEQTSKPREQNNRIEISETNLCIYRNLNKNFSLTEAAEKIGLLYRNYEIELQPNTIYKDKI